MFQTSIKSSIHPAVNSPCIGSLEKINYAQENPNISIHALRRVLSEYDWEIVIKKYDRIIKVIINNPKLMERPIVTTNTKAIIGKPPENVLKLLN